MAKAEARRLAVGGMLAMAAAIGIGRFVYTPILPPMAEALSFSSSEAGFIASANFLGYLLGALAAALPTLPGPKRGWLLAALTVSAGSTMAMALPSTLAPFLALRVVGGAASAFVVVFACSIVLERLAAARQGPLSAIHFSGVGIGVAVSAATVSVIAVGGGDWRSLWMTTGLMAASTVLAVAWLVPARSRLDRGEPPAAAIRSRRKDANTRARTAFIVGYGLFGFGYVITSTFLVAIVRATPEIQASEPFIWLLFGLAAIPSVEAWTRVGARFGTGRAFALACLLQAAGVILSVLWLSFAGVILAAVLLGWTFMGITALGLAGARESTPGDSRRILALATVSFSLGQMIGPAVAGLVRDALGNFVVPSLLAAGALVLAAAIVARATRLSRSAPAPVAHL